MIINFLAYCRKIIHAQRYFKTVFTCTKRQLLLWSQKICIEWIGSCLELVPSSISIKSKWWQLFINLNVNLKTTLNSLKSLDLQVTRLKFHNNKKQVSLLTSNRFFSIQIALICNSNCFKENNFERFLNFSHQLLINLTL